jgi:hypothetical protein
MQQGPSVRTCVAGSLCCVACCRNPVTLTSWFSRCWLYSSSSCSAQLLKAQVLV